MQKEKLFFEKRLLRKETPPEARDVQAQNPDKGKPGGKEVEDQTKQAEAEIKATERKAVDMVAQRYGLKVRTNENPIERDYVLSGGGQPIINMMLDKRSGTYVVFAPGKGKDWEFIESTRSSTMTGLASRVESMGLFRNIKEEADVLREFSSQSGLEFKTESFDSGKTTHYSFSRADGTTAFHITYDAKEKKYFLVQHGANGLGEKLKSRSPNIRALLGGFDKKMIVASNEN